MIEWEMIQYHDILELLWKKVGLTFLNQKMISTTLSW